MIEHRATPEQALIADFAMKRELGVGLPRGGAVVLPPHLRPWATTRNASL